MMIRNLLKPFIAVLGILLAGAAVSCEGADEGTSGAALTLGETLYGDDNRKTDVPLSEDYTWANPRSGGIKAFYIYSDLSSWRIEPASEEDLAWVEIWPGAGSRDGRFYVRILQNETAEARETTLRIVSAGVVRRSLLITQQASGEQVKIADK